MNGYLTYYPYHVPQIGESVYIFVGGKSFPTGVWKGVLIATKFELPVSQLEPLDVICSTRVKCIASITDDCAPVEWRNREPKGEYFVYPDELGMEEMLNKLRDQKEEVKALKRRLEENEQTARDVFKGLFKLAGVDILDVTRQSSGLGAIYAPSVKK